MPKPTPSLPDLEAQIAQAEEARDFHQGFLKRAEAAGLSLRRAQNLLRQAEEQLTRLQRKRETLLGKQNA